MCSEVSFFFNLGARRLKVLLSVKTFWLERRGVCMPHVKMSLHSDRSKGSLPDAETEIRKKGNGEAGLSPRKMLWPWIYAVHMDINTKTYLYRAQL